MTVTFMTFSYTVCKSNNLYFLYFKNNKLFFEKKWKIYFFEKLNETGTSLYFLAVEKVAVSLPTKS